MGGVVWLSVCGGPKISPNIARWNTKNASRGNEEMRVVLTDTAPFLKHLRGGGCGIRNAGTIGDARAYGAHECMQSGERRELSGNLSRKSLNRSVRHGEGGIAQKKEWRHGLGGTANNAVAGKGLYLSNGENLRFFMSAIQRMTMHDIAKTVDEGRQIVAVSGLHTPGNDTLPIMRAWG